jgi:hypothetical protein
MKKELEAEIRYPNNLIDGRENYFLIKISEQKDGKFFGISH